MKIDDRPARVSHVSPFSPRKKKTNSFPIVPNDFFQIRPRFSRRRELHRKKSIFRLTCSYSSHDSIPATNLHTSSTAHSAHAPEAAEDVVEAAPEEEETEDPASLPVLPPPGEVCWAGRGTAGAERSRGDEGTGVGSSSGWCSCRCCCCCIARCGCSRPR